VTASALQSSNRSVEILVFGERQTDVTRVPPILRPRVERDHAGAACELDEDKIIDAKARFRTKGFLVEPKRAIEVADRQMHMVEPRDSDHTRSLCLPRRIRPIEQLRREWADEVRATAVGPGTVRIARCDDETETWAEIEIGNGQADDLVRLLQEAFADADEVQVRPPDRDG